MKKIVILSYFYPPCNLTASQRVYAFARYLPDSGFYPIVVTRNWDIRIKNQFDISKPSGKEVIHERSGNSEVYYLPFKGSRRDRFIEKYGKDKFTLYRKILTFCELIMESFERFPKAWMTFYHKADELIRKEKAEYLLISANPFWQFYFGYLLKKKYPHLKWVADYRDDWTTGELGRKYDFGSRIIHRFARKNEKKWLKEADLITSVSTILSQRIGEFVDKPFKTIANGFFIESIDVLKKLHNPKEFIITYTGYLYQQQRVDWFINALKQAIDKHRQEVFIKVQFIGSGYEPVTEQRIRKLMQGYEKNLLITERLSREDSIRVEAASDLLLMVAYRDFKGIPGSKLYQYIGNQKPIFLCPSDNDIVENILEETGLGIICHSQEEAVKKLEDLILKHIRLEPLIPELPRERYMKYSRCQQVARLAGTLQSL